MKSALLPTPWDRILCQFLPHFRFCPPFHSERELMQLRRLVSFTFNETKTDTSSRKGSTWTVQGLNFQVSCLVRQLFSPDWVLYFSVFGIFLRLRDRLINCFCSTV